ncbi:PotD/PotF family extracellular solute-binding protein [Vibrio mimicus]
MGNAPMINRGKVTLRVLGTSVTLTEEICQQARKDLGFNIEFFVENGVACQKQGVLYPHTYDVYDQWFQSIDMLWPVKAIQPLELNRIEHWDKVNSFSKYGYFDKKTDTAAGCTPCKRLYVQADNSLSDKPSDRISMLPLTHNADSFGYKPDLLPHQLQDQQESWAWLVSKHWSGKVGVQVDSTIGILDLALAVQSSGKIVFDDLGNLTIDEIDKLISLLLDLKRQGQFCSKWNNILQATENMLIGGVGIESIWSPSFSNLRSQNLDIINAAPKEGYRAWFGGLAISSKTNNRTLDAAYEYLNWWLSGWAGAQVAKQGYYISTPSLSRKFLDESEWQYWYEGKEAKQNLRDSKNNVIVKSGEVRSGGSYRDRMSKIAVWNTVMDEQNYLVRRWNDFLNS